MFHCGVASRTYLLQFALPVLHQEISLDGNLLEATLNGWP